MHKFINREMLLNFFFFSVIENLFSPIGNIGMFDINMFVITINK